MQIWSVPHVHPVSGHAVPQSSVPPQPSPITPQYVPPATVHPVRQTVPAATQTLFSHCWPVGQAPQCWGCPQLSPISPQYWVVPVLQVNAGQRPPSVLRSSGSTRMGGVSDADAGPPSGEPIPPGASVDAPTLLSTLQPAVHARTQTAHPRTTRFARRRIPAVRRLTDPSRLMCVSSQLVPHSSVLAIGMVLQGMNCELHCSTYRIIHVGVPPSKRVDPEVQVSGELRRFAIDSLSCRPAVQSVYSCFLARP